MGALWVWVSVLFFITLQLGLEVGSRLGKRRAEEPNKGTDAVASIVYGLLTLLLSFSFSLAVARFDARRHIIVDEANSVGTAYLRLDLLPEPSQPSLKAAFVRYTDARLAFNNALSNGTDPSASLKTTGEEQVVIWTKAMSAYRTDPHESTRIQLTPALNEMFDLAAARSEAVETRVPWIIFLLLASVSLASSLLIGKALAPRPTRSWGYRLIFSVVVVFVSYVIADLDDPRQGLIRINDSDKILREIRSTMH